MGQNKKIKNKKRFYITLSIFLVVITAGLAYGAYTYNRLRNPRDLFQPVQGSELNINDEFDGNIINIMLLGFDKNEERSEDSTIFRSDTNIVVSINLEKETVDMISIPRDSYVSIANRDTGKDKFNAAYGYGYRFGGGQDKEEDGFQYVMDTASKLLGGAPIHHYVAVDMDVVVEIVDAIGGVDIEVPMDLYRRNGKDRSRVRIQQGYQKLDGKDLLYFARYRQLPRGDIDRAENQQKILMATFDSLKKSNMFSSLPKIYQSFQANIQTNLNLNQIAALALFGMELEKDNITTHTMPGDFGTLNALSYWIIDQQKRVQLIEEIYGVTVAVEEQDPKEETLISLDVHASNTILEIGQRAEISASGTTNLGHKKLFDPGDLHYNSSNTNIVSVNQNGVITANGAGNASIAIRLGDVSRQINITVNKPKDTTPPTISLIGKKNITIKQGQSFNDPGVKAVDDIDGDITSRVVISYAPEKVDTNKPGTYTITYNVSDRAGNAAKSITRTVIIEEVKKEEPKPEPEPEPKPEPKEDKPDSKDDKKEESKPKDESLDEEDQESNQQNQQEKKKKDNTNNEQ